MTSGISSMVRTRRLHFVSESVTPENIGLLKSVRSDQRAADLTGDADQGDGIHLGVGNAGHEIGRSGTAGGHGHANFAGDAGVSLCGEDRALLMPGQNVPNTAAFERVV